MTDYSIYDQLDMTEPHFRLVSIHPTSNEEEPIRCSLITTKMEEAPEYEALSYTWGDPKDPEPITVNDRPFFATRNLAQALQGLRYEDRDRIMWIDAIAICQTDNVEKNNQIPLMTRIYGDAARVIVWLGNGEESAEFIRSVHRDNLHWDTRNHPSYKYNVVQVVIMLRSLYTSSWWERVWTIQEMMLARELEFHCSRGVILTEEEVFSVPHAYARHTGNCCRHWDETESTGMPNLTFESSVQGLLQPIRTMFNFRGRIRGKDNNKLWLEPLAAQFRHRKATDPRDKLYGLLGISHYSVCPPPIDYRRPVAECYKAMACWMIHSSRRLDVLNSVITHPPEANPSTPLLREEPITENIPSWCPNWTALPNKRLLMGTELRMFDFVLYNACMAEFDADLFFLISEHPTSSEFQMMVPNETDHYWMPNDGIGLLGLPVDTVKAVDKQELTVINQTLPQWKALAKSTVTTSSLKDSTYPAGNENAEEALNRTLCADIIRRNLHEGNVLFPALPVFFSDAKDVEQVADEFARLWTTVEAMKPGVVDHSLFTHEFPTVLSAINIATANRRFFVTEKGYFGLGPPEMQEGDSVWVLSGGSTPYILRRNEGSLSWSWTFVGDAYVHGIMHGEALSEHVLDNGSIAFQVVALK